MIFLTPMIAYVFWHWPRMDVPLEDYERRLQTFHDRLRKAPPPGYLRSSVRSIIGASWVPAGPAYEDWYLLDHTGDLDALGSGAVTDPLKESHDGIAGLAAGGTAGLYKPVREAEAANGAIAFWFAKPEGMTYEALYAGLETLEAGASQTLWQRMLTLGPTPEFCLLRNRALALPSGWKALRVERAVVWNPIQSA